MVTDDTVFANAKTIFAKNVLNTKNYLQPKYKIFIVKVKEIQ